MAHEELLRGTQGRGRFGARNPLRMHVSALHRKLGDSAEQPVWILSERGVGYRMAEPGDAAAREAGPAERS